MVTLAVFNSVISMPYNSLEYMDGISLPRVNRSYFEVNAFKHHIQFMFSMNIFLEDKM